MRRKLVASVSATALATVAVAALGTGVAQATPAAAGFSGAARTSDVSIEVGSKLFGLEGTKVAVAPAEAKADSNSTPKSSARAANVEIQAGNGNLTVPSEVSQVAPPANSGPVKKNLDLMNTPVKDLIQAKLLEGTAAANYAQNPCATQPLSEATTDATDLTVGAGTLTNLVSQYPQIADAVTPLTKPVDELLAPLQGVALAKANGVVSSKSNVSLVDAPGQPGKAVQSSSEIKGGDLTLFAGTANQIDVKLISSPTLTAVSTGDAKTSRVDYKAPVLEILQGGKKIADLNATTPMTEVPLSNILPSEVLDSLKKIDLGVVKISIADVTKNINGNKAEGEAALVDVALLPEKGGKALVDTAIGKQSVQASAPKGGVKCDGNNGGGDNGGNNGGGNGNQGKDNNGALANTGDTSKTTSILIGGGILFVGAAVIAATPARRRVLSMVKKG